VVRLGRGSGGVGDGTFGPPVAFAAGVGRSGLTSGDFNEYGNVDLAVGNIGNLAAADSGSVSILIGHGDGTFAAPTNFPAGINPFNAVTGDFDQDGILDLAVPSNGTNAVFVLRGHGSGGVGDGTFARPASYAIDNLSTGIATGDFNEEQWVPARDRFLAAERRAGDARAVRRERT